jgi:hypothetical protein
LYLELCTWTSKFGLRGLVLPGSSLNTSIFALGSWNLAVGSWKLDVGRWNFAPGTWYRGALDSSTTWWLYLSPPSTHCRAVCWTTH